MARPGNRQCDTFVRYWCKSSRVTAELSHIEVETALYNTNWTLYGRLTQTFVSILPS